MEGVLLPYEKVKKESRIALYGYNNIMDEIYSYIEEHLNLKGYIFLSQIVWIVLILHLQAMYRPCKKCIMRYNSCAGVLHSCKDVPHRLVQEAAEKCVEANACKYSYFKKVLSMVQNNHSSSAINGTGKLPSHTNIRGKEAYK